MNIEIRTLTLCVARAMAQEEADEHNIVMVVGWMFDEFAPDCRAYGYCPKHVAGPATVYDVLEEVAPQ